jgi:phosphatidylinositol-binding clathrin assembly protein
VFKGLIVAHIMIRDGAKEVSLRYLEEQPRYFSIGQISVGISSLRFWYFREPVLTLLVSEQGQHIRDYARYLQVRVQAWKDLKYDYASQNPSGEQVGRLKDLKVEKGLLRETEILLRLVGALLKCKVRSIASMFTDASSIWGMLIMTSH